MRSPKKDMGKYKTYSHGFLTEMHSLLRHERIKGGLNAGPLAS